jgi:hypothetical protein
MILYVAHCPYVKLFGITEFLHFVQSLLFRKNTVFAETDLRPSTDEKGGRHLLCWVRYKVLIVQELELTLLRNQTE